MKLVKVNLEAINREKELHAYLGNYRLLDEFRNMPREVNVVEVVDFKHASARVCVNSLRESIKRFKMHNIRVMMRGERVFLYRDF